MTINKIIILEGGYNEEHEVSIKSSLEIQKVLKNKKIDFKVLRVNKKNFEKKIVNYKNYLCFNALHGPYGEDGQIQKILKKNKIKFTHSGYLSSKICFDKYKTKKIIKENKILTPKFHILDLKDLSCDYLFKLKYIYKKFVIKPTSSGSSFGIKIIKNSKDFKKLIKNIHKFKIELINHKNILIEEYISGKELTVSTIKFSKKIKALAVTEIKSKNNFFDYKAKYSKGYSKHILPAKIPKKLYNRCMNISLKCHQILKCKSIARTDFILNTKDNKIYFLETNTQPGLTSVSLLPEQAKYKKISFEDIVLGILKNNNMK